jgi:hypothetical protein
VTRTAGRGRGEASSCEGRGEEPWTRVPADRVSDIGCEG